MLKQLIKALIRISIAFAKTNWIKFFSLKSRNANTILWIPPKNIKYFIGESFLWDMGKINAFISTGTPFKIIYGKKIGRISNKTIYHTINRNTNLFGFLNYADVYEHVVNQLEKQNNLVIPSLTESKLWENKAHMHQEFENKHVRCPKSIIFPINEIPSPIPFDFPFLIKTEHSSSSEGVYKISNLEDFNKIVKDNDIRNENEFLIFQKLVNMRKDLRVILVGEEITHFYWRINLGKDWKPTSTSHGSDVDFVTFPEKWRQDMIDTFKCLNLSTGAFDVTWENDDLESQPLYLEISPVYQPNPKIEVRKKHYGWYKKSISPTNPYHKKYIELIFKIVLLQFDYISKKNK